MASADPLKDAAHRAVTYAVAGRRLVPPNTLPCVVCGNQARLYHHANGYDEAHWLDVEARCGPCHWQAHPHPSPMKGRRFTGKPRTYLFRIAHLRTIREEAGLSREALAELSGVKAATIGLAETGRKHPRPITVRKLAKALGREPSDLMEPLDGEGYGD